MSLGAVVASLLFLGQGDLICDIDLGTLSVAERGYKHLFCSVSVFQWKARKKPKVHLGSGEGFPSMMARR